MKNCVVHHNEWGSDIRIYIHWPFCISRCPYCDFNVYVSSSIDYDFWEEAFLSEIAYWRPSIENKYIKSIFFGGGTPSIMPFKIISNLIQTINKIAVVDKETEISIEVNPSEATLTNFEVYKSIGINRISIGVQSFDDNALDILGRRHTAKQALDGIDQARKYFTNYSIDLMYGRQSQVLAKWERELEQLIKISPPHVSLYQLTIKKGTKFYIDYIKKRLTLPSDELSYNMYMMACSVLQRAGILQYEVSNYAIAGKESIHNTGYWQYENYIGLGPGAHGRVSSFQHNISNLRCVQSITAFCNLDSWKAAVYKYGVGIETVEVLNEYEASLEVVIMGLRTISGVKLEALRNYTNTDFASLFNNQALQQYMDAGYLYYDSEVLRLTAKGLVVYDYILPKIMS